MATGTGTEQNPYIVTTMEDVYTYCNTYNVYVKLGANIYIKDDVTYRSGTTTPLTIACKKFYSDNGYGIYGLNVTATNMIVINRLSSMQPVIENVGFLSWIHNRTSNAPSIITTYNAGGAQTQNAASFTNCKFSFLIKCSNPAYVLSPIIQEYREISSSVYCYLTFTNCSIYVKESVLDRTTLATYYYGNLMQGTFSYCYILCDSVTFGRFPNGSGSINLFNVDTAHCTVVLTDWFSYNTGEHNAGSYRVMNMSNGVFYMQGACSTDYWNGMKVSGSGVAYIGVTNVPYPVYTGVTSCTESQIKDQSYLTGIGFLP